MSMMPRMALDSASCRTRGATATGMQRRVIEKAPWAVASGGGPDSVSGGGAVASGERPRERCPLLRRGGESPRRRSGLAACAAETCSNEIGHSDDVQHGSPMRKFCLRCSDVGECSRLRDFGMKSIGSFQPLMRLEACEYIRNCSGGCVERVATCGEADWAGGDGRGGLGSAAAGGRPRAGPSPTSRAPFRRRACYGAKGAHEPAPHPESSSITSDTSELCRCMRVAGTTALSWHASVQQSGCMQMVPPVSVSLGRSDGCHREESRGGHHAAAPRGHGPAVAATAARGFFAGGGGSGDSDRCFAAITKATLQQVGRSSIPDALQRAVTEMKQQQHTTC